MKLFMPFDPNFVKKKKSKKEKKKREPAGHIIAGKKYLKMFHSYHRWNLGEFHCFLLYLSVFSQFHTIQCITFIHRKCFQVYYTGMVFLNLLLIITL